MRGIKDLFLSLLFMLGLTSPVVGQVLDPQNILINNLYIATVDAEDVPVNLLIRDNKLELVSQDQIPVPDGFVALDAAGGYLIGNLILGEPPSFIILDADPRTDVEVLLDTKRHSLYAVYKGELRKNTFQYNKKYIPEVKKPEHHAWLGYTPPPVALPTRYGDRTPWNQWKTENTTGVFFAVLALDRNHWLSQDDNSEEQVGSLEKVDGGEVRDLRLGVFGTLNFFNRRLGYNFVLDSNAFSKRFEVEDRDDFKALDYRLDIPVFDTMKLSIGKQKEPISMERIMTLTDQPMQERSSVADAFLLSRNFGIILSGNALDDHMSWAGGVFNNFIDTDVSLNNGETSISGRVTWLPFVSDDESNLVHLGLAARSSDGSQGYLYQTTPEFNKSPLFVDTGFGDADAINQYDIEASWRRGPFWLAAEHVGTLVDSPTNGDLSFSGYNVTASWILTGEMRDYRNKSGTFGSVPISRSVYQNGFGAWEIGTRWSRIDLNDGAVAGGEMDIFSLAVSWWLSSKFNVNINYRYIWNERDNLNGETSGINMRVLLKL